MLRRVLTFGPNVATRAELCVDRVDAVVGYLEDEATVDRAVAGLETTVDAQRRRVQVLHALGVQTHAKQGASYKGERLHCTDCDAHEHTATNVTYTSAHCHQCDVHERTLPPM